MHSLVRYCGHHRGRDLISSIGNLNNYERDGYKNVSLKIEAALFQTSNADDFFRSGMLKAASTRVQKKKKKIVVLCLCSSLSCNHGKEMYKKSYDARKLLFC